MSECYAPGDNRNAAVGIAAFVAIFQVASDRATDRTHLYSDLMFASGEKFDLDKAQAVSGCDCAVAQP